MRLDRHWRRWPGKIEIAGFDAVALAQQDRALEQVAELARIAGPAVRGQAVHCAGSGPCEGRRARRELAALMTQQESGGDGGDVARTLGQRLEVKRHDIQAPVEN